MPPEELPKFYEVMRSGLADVVNGVRLVYPMQDQAMQFANMVANYGFGLTFSWLLGQRIKDTLCGTKVLRRSDWQRVEPGLATFGDRDPFGDFDLILGATRQNLKIRDLPVRYRARTYGETKISRFRDGLRLLRLTFFAWRLFKWSR
jgi:hypothetical protein